MKIKNYVEGDCLLCGIRVRGRGLRRGHARRYCTNYHRIIACNMRTGLRILREKEAENKCK